MFDPSITIDVFSVLQIVSIGGQLTDTDAELMVLFHKMIRIHSVTGTKLLLELALSEVVAEGLGRLFGSRLSSELKYNLLDAIVYKKGILMILATNAPQQDKLDFFLIYISEKSIKASLVPNVHDYILFQTRRRVEYIFQIEMPETVSFLAPYHESSLPKVTLHVPNIDECAVVFPCFVLLISDIEQNNRNIIREEFNDTLLGVGKFSNT